MQEVFPEEQAERLAQVLVEVSERTRKELEDCRFDLLATRDEFADLTRVVAELANAQKELALAQARTEERVEQSPVHDGERRGDRDQFLR